MPSKPITAAKAMSDAWESGISAIRADAILKEQVTAIYADLDAIAEQGHDSVSRHD